MKQRKLFGGCQSAAGDVHSEEQGEKEPCRHREDQPPIESSGEGAESWVFVGVLMSVVEVRSFACEELSESQNNPQNHCSGEQCDDHGLSLEEERAEGVPLAEGTNNF